VLALDSEILHATTQSSFAKAQKNLAEILRLHSRNLIPILAGADYN
jgi:hypothetical protein